jgi:dolichyl-phosphate beta-glucosyltransferase
MRSIGHARPASTATSRTGYPGVVDRAGGPPDRELSRDAVTAQSPWGRSDALRGPASSATCGHSSEAIVAQTAGDAVFEQALDGAAPANSASKPAAPIGHAATATDARPRATLASLVIPAHNEEHRLFSTLMDYAAALAARYEADFEVLVVVNGSTDMTAEVARRAATLYPQIAVIDIAQPIGKGGAVLEGFRRAAGERVIFADADGATGSASLVQLLAALDECDIAIGSRRLPESLLMQTQPLNRRLLGHMFRAVVRRWLALPFADTQCGAKAFRTEVARSIGACVTETRWTFDIDLLLRAAALGATVKECPVEWTDQPGSKLSVLPTMIDVAASLLRIKRTVGSSSRLDSTPLLAPTAAQ